MKAVGFFRKVLIVDDNKTYLRFAESALSSAGFEVLTAEDIWISPVVAREKPGLILMDVTIGSANGTSAVKAIKKRSFGQGIKIVLHSSESDAKLAELSTGCDADGYVCKDGNADNLIRRVRQFLCVAT